MFQITKTLLYIIEIFFIIMISSCQAKSIRENLKNCKYEIKSVKIENITFPAIELDAVLSIYNPNKTEVAVDRMDVDFYLEKKFVGSAKNSQSIIIQPYFIEQIHLQINTTFSEVGFLLLATLKSQGPIYYEIKGIVYFNVPLIGELPVPIYVEDKITYGNSKKSKN